MLWNLNKTYLKDLARAGVRIPPTVFLARGTRATLTDIFREQGFTGAVLKPDVSATAWRTRRVSATPSPDDQAHLDELLVDSGVLVQEFVDEVVHDGEWSLIYLGGRFSHAVLKRPRPGDYRVQDDFGGSYRLTPPPARLVEQGRDVLAAVPGAPDLLYARVDGVARDGGLVLMELELIEPVLFFGADAGAPGRFAEALQERLGDA